MELKSKPLRDLLWKTFPDCSLLAVGLEDNRITILKVTGYEHLMKTGESYQQEYMKFRTSSNSFIASNVKVSTFSSKFCEHGIISRYVANSCLNITKTVFVQTTKMW